MAAVVAASRASSAPPHLHNTLPPTHVFPSSMRWLALVMYAVSVSLLTAQWIAFGPTVATFQRCLGVSLTVANALPAFALLGPALSPFTASHIGRRLPVYSLLVLGALCNVASAAVRLFAMRQLSTADPLPSGSQDPAATVAVLFVAQALTFVSTLLHFCCPARLVVLWFPMRERSMAGAVAANSRHIGLILISIFSPLLVPAPGDLPALETPSPMWAGSLSAGGGAGVAAPMSGPPPLKVVSACPVGEDNPFDVILLVMLWGSAAVATVLLLVLPVRPRASGATHPHFAAAAAAAADAVSAPPPVVVFGANVARLPPLPTAVRLAGIIPRSIFAFFAASIGTFWCLTTISPQFFIPLGVPLSNAGVLVAIAGGAAAIVSFGARYVLAFTAHPQHRPDRYKWLTFVFVLCVAVALIAGVIVALDGTGVVSVALFGAYVAVGAGLAISFHLGLVIVRVAAERANAAASAALAASVAAASLAASNTAATATSPTARAPPTQVTPLLPSVRTAVSGSDTTLVPVDESEVTEAARERRDDCNHESCDWCLRDPLPLFAVRVALSGFIRSPGPPAHAHVGGRAHGAPPLVGAAHPVAHDPSGVGESLELETAAESLQTTRDVLLACKISSLFVSAGCIAGSIFVMLTTVSLQLQGVTLASLPKDVPSMGVIVPAWIALIVLCLLAGLAALHWSRPSAMTSTTT